MSRPFGFVVAAMLSGGACAAAQAEKAMLDDWFDRRFVTSAEHS